MADTVTTKEELAADLVWHYVERLRAAESPAEIALDGPEIQRLVSALEAAGGVPEALAVEEPEAQKEAVRTRLQPELARSTPRQAVPSPVRRRTGIPTITVPAWQFRLALAASLIGTLLLTTVNGWHHSPASVQRVAVWREPQGLEPMDEDQAHRLIPAMLRNQLSPSAERSLMGHMLVCTGCYEDYRAAKGSPVAQQPGPVTYAAHR